MIAARLALAALLIPACFNPQIVDGGLRCTPGGWCPDGFACAMPTGRCWRGKPDAGAAETAPAAEQLAELADCDTLHDHCAPGLACLPDNCGGRCYRLCAGEADCPMSTCAKKTTDGKRACDVPRFACSPGGWAAGTLIGCPVTRDGCYVSSAVVDRTVCDCPGGGRQGDGCAESQDCLVGFVCVDATGSGDKRCRRACELTRADMCSPMACRPYTVGGATSATYGFCY